ncbi:Galactose oxidase/kelch repeat superfamily protein [Striga hermonthica]|uniref:Galactose oxidase/kelch repeat superfamily protein n=1 Tax=Striga hermonthica TaxID=68872 RepID=A0A9N7P500_STRHE|nr:Galactose oxidase/kelch repeat superfamily protein [Striga hermonthica]
MPATFLDDPFTVFGEGPGARSSHAITVVGQKAYSFGGEFVPRVPVNNHLHVFDLVDWTWSVANAQGQIPPPRVGVSMSSIGETIYVFGGRDEAHKELNEFYSFDTHTNTWAMLPSGPAHRSYHEFDKEWVEFSLSGKSVKPRGGPGLASVLGKIWVLYGFAGMEVDDLHYFDLKEGKWVQVETDGENPRPRSVFSTLGIGKYIFVYGGEIDPSDLGHMVAGKFAGDVYALDTETLVWKKWDDGLGCEDHPGPRGWCAFSSGQLHGQEGLLVYGGNSPSNDRLNDIFFFTPFE